MLDLTISTTIPDANQHVFTDGLGYQRGHHALEGACSLELHADRNIKKT